VVIEKDVSIGKNNRFFPGCVIGGLPQMLGLDDNRTIGRLIIGDNNTFHEHVTIHPSIHEGHSTEIGDENFLMVGSHIGHDSLLGNRIVLSNGVQISGHCKLGDGAWLSGMAGVHQFVTVGKWVYVAGLAGINKDIPPFLTVSGHYPPKVRGVNMRGLKRGGYSPGEQERIVWAYKRLYRRDGSLLERARALAKEDGLDENVKAMVDSIDKSSQHRYGRYLELYRHG
jgi:UDP-N-acetylglucosamine acyltransferase